ncbi:HPr(Ser) kinase/phosphatase [Acutalibacter sp. 1XD8-33]|uniref:HPr(Ser) kinase/phosphatase n=1 Tax=Acutalibacter sp. 1XD8-33 TaxID=2320081 RepID=UPI000EA02BD5|nr:HPr(Ser) kinase/phosphatase [Acutalibacter sp. 1XD8-33]RKJ38989.1 HPr(Ser) kinase/phosphatase [Acutalibacter sp. 1XD8-33]
MVEEYTLPLSKIIENQGLTPLYLPRDPSLIPVRSRDVTRPGLELNGFYEYFDTDRIAILGRSEMGLLNRFGEEPRTEAIERYFALHPVAVILARGIQPWDMMLAAAEKYEIPLLLSQDTTSSALASLVAYLNVELAPRITRHGVFMEVYGEGILLVGDSGVGKSEAAIELIKRGHRLIADDAVEIRRVSSISLVGQAPENIRHFIELRGIGVINAQRIFGTGAVKPTQKIELCIKLEPWDAAKVYDRMGIENAFTEILGIRIPVITIPVKPGRNLAVIIEVAAMNNRQKEMGYNAAQELLANMGVDMDGMESSEIKMDLDI